MLLWLVGTVCNEVGWLGWLIVEQCEGGMGCEVGTAGVRGWGVVVVGHVVV